MTPSSFVARVAALSLSFCAVAFGGCGNDMAFVGGTCRAPYSACGHACVDLENDSSHCGACDVACAPGVQCSAGRCEGVPEAGAIDAGVDRTTVGDAPADVSIDAYDDARVDAADAASDGSDAALGDGAAADAADGSADACAPPYVTDLHCGDCFTRCQGVNDACKVGDAGVYTCAPFCAGTLSRCGNSCVDWQSDGDNCGACNRVCASNICVKGVCQGTASGDIVYIGHDYATTPLKTSQARLLENAVLLAPKTPVRVLAYQRYASANAVIRVTAILADAQTRAGRTVQLTGTSSDAALTGVTKTNYDVVLVYDQVASPAGSMSALGTAASSALSAFTHVGGVFIVLDGAAGPNAQMHAFSTGTGLLTVLQHQSVAAGEQLAVIAPTDALASGVVSPFAMRVATARLIPEANGGAVSWVARHVATGQATVVHKIAP